MTDQLEFIQMQVYPNFSKCLYQYFDDAEKKDPTLTCKGKFITEQSFGVLEEANKKGAGIFFSVNGFDEEERKKDKVTTINAWICEIDGIEKEFQKQLIELCPLKPSMIVESKNGFHLYRFAKDGTKENREKICCGVRNFFDGDPNAITIERVLRLPGFEHCKNNNDRFLCKIYDYNGATYTEEQMLAKYPNTKSVREKKDEAQTMKFETKKDDGDFWERVGSFDTRQMLQMLARTKFMTDDIDFKKNSNGTEQIFCNGKSTACRLDKNGLIGSKTGGGPTWIQWIKWYGDIDWKDLYQRLIEKFPDLKKEKKEPVVIEKPTKKRDNLKKAFLYPGEVFKSFDCMTTHEFVMIASGSNVGKSTFVNAIASLAGLNDKVAYLNLEFPIDNMLEIFYKRKIGCTDENIVRKGTNLLPYTENEKQGLTRYIAKCKSIIDYYDLGQGMLLKDIVEKIQSLSNEGYSMIVVDSFSSIEDCATSIDMQVKIAQTFHELVKLYPINLIAIHHFNKQNKDFSGSRKLFDLSNRFIVIEKKTSDQGGKYRKFTMTKSKEHSDEPVANTVYVNGEYLEYVL